jgi:hypothetical protein
MYYGTIITEDQYNELLSIIDWKCMNKLVSDFESESEPTIDICIYSLISVRKFVNKYFLFISTTYYNIRNNDVVFKQDDIKQGFISRSDLENYLWQNNISESKFKAIFYPDKNETENLNAIISLLNFDHSKDDLKLIVCLEIVEILNNNDTIGIGSGVVTHILPVK